MNKNSLRALRERADGPMDGHAIETLVGVAVAAWTFGQIVFVHATVGQLPFAREFSLGVCCQAVALGCLIAAIASRRFEFEPAGLVALGVFLFVVITFWNKSKDPRLLVLALLVIAARRMNLRRLLRFYAGGAVAALLCVLALAVFGVTTIKYTPSPGFGFANVKTVGCLLMGIVAAICIIEDKRDMRIPCFVLCLACAAVTVIVLRTMSYAVFMVIIGACVLGRDVLTRFASRLMAHREFGWFMAALPIVLFCLCQDTGKLFPFASFVKGGYSSVLGQYGFAALCCFAMVYVRAALLADRGHRTTFTWAMLLMYLLLLTSEPNLMYLEFNGLLVFLALGADKGVMGLCEPRIRAHERGGE